MKCKTTGKGGLLYMEYLRPSLSHGLVSFICEKLLNSHILLIFDMDGTLRIRASDKKIVV